jgi:D-amino peptidase
MKKLYISADIEGVAGICEKAQSDKASPTEYAPFREQMTAEVGAACAGSYAAGVDEVLIKDAHWTGRNIDSHKLSAPPGKQLRLIRGWSGHPFAMVQEIDSSFTAAAFVGYHSAAGSAGNPMAHTISGRSFARILLNDQIASEFLIYAYAAASVGVPVVFLSGDEAQCLEARRFIDGIETVATMQGVGDSVVSMLPAEAVHLIERGLQSALKGEIPRPLTVPTDIAVRVTFHKASAAYAKSFYPNAKQVSDTELLFETTRYLDALTFLWIAAQ